MARILLVNGINTHGEKNVDLFFRLESEGHQVVDVTLPKRGVISSWFTGKADARRLLKRARYGDIVIAHSRGGIVAALASRFNFFRQIFLIGPAMSRKWDWSLTKAGGSIFCFYSKTDFWVRVGSLIPGHPFGQAGTHGFTDSRVINTDCSGTSHGGYFEGEKFEELYAFIRGRIESASTPIPHRN